MKLTLSLKPLALLLAISACPLLASADMEPIPPFMGDWKGGWVDAPEKDRNAVSNPGLVARVIGLGNDTYEIQILEEFEKRADYKVKTTATLEDGKLTFDENGFVGEITEDSFTGVKKGANLETPFSLTRWQRESPTLGMAPPEGAVVLFDGDDLDAWQQENGEAPTWLIQDGYFEVLPKRENNNLGGSIQTRETFGDIRVHLEFRLPYEPEHLGQKRANSGFFVPGGYEVQILDSYGLGGMWNECGSLYKQSPPKVNMCWAPGVWQTYDVEFKQPHLDSGGNKVEDAVITVWHNGVKVHDNYPIPGPTANTQIGRDGLESGASGPLSLQDHSNKIRFRNIWVVEE
ncbi:MAG: DUF1080 domain-containing protein [Verrucomicrobiota bacterium]